VTVCHLHAALCRHHTQAEWARQAGRAGTQGRQELRGGAATLCHTTVVQEGASTRRPCVAYTACVRQYMPVRCGAVHTGKVPYAGSGS
jgi:hypothetical protein